jgi:hypothetical protein
MCEWIDVNVSNCPTALAAIQLCESLLLTLVNKGLLSIEDAIETVEAVVATNQQNAEEEGSKLHQHAAEIAGRIAISVAAAE